MFFSIIIPVKRLDPFYELLLASLAKSTFRDFEVLLIADGWDIQLSKSYAYPIKLLSSRQQRGPAFCRNLGARQAVADYLVFCDADVTIHENTLEKSAFYLENEPINGLIGSYDFAPACCGGVSQFRNLLHSYHHQKNHGSIGVFWGAFGVVEKAAFFEAGQFDAQKYSQPSIEDIELGYRLFNLGYKIYLKSDVLIKHHKCWSLKTMFKTDRTLRAIPWQRLIMENKFEIPTPLNTSTKERAGALVALSFLPIGVLCWMLGGFFWLLLLFPIAIQVVLQWRLYSFFKQNMTFSNFVFSLIYHQLYFYNAVSGYTFARLGVNI